MRYKKELDDTTCGQIAAELKSCAESSADLDIRMEKVKEAIEANRDT